MQPHHSFRPSISTALLSLAVACSGTQLVTPDAQRCPQPSGEFGPTDCAIVEGLAFSSSSLMLVGQALAVDSAVPMVGYAYDSNVAVTDGSGSFHLTVYRVSRLRPLTTPDTASIEIKAYAGPSPKAGTIPIGRALVRLTFAPLGALITTSTVAAHFDSP